MVVEWVACLGQTHKNGNTVQMKQEIDMKRGQERGDDRETRKRRPGRWWLSASANLFTS